MKLAGKDVSDLSAQYQKLDRRIKSDNAGPGGAEYSTCKNSGWRSGRS